MQFTYDPKLPPAPEGYADAFSGGGMNCATGAGVCEGRREHGILRPKYGVAISGNGPNRLFEEAQGMDCAREVWPGDLCTGEFIYKNHLCLDYLIDTLDRKRKLNTDALQRSENEIIIPALNVKTGKVRLFSTKEHPEMSSQEYRRWIFDVMRAGMAHPLAYRKKVYVEGEQYIDGGFGLSLAAAVELAAKKANNILVVDNENPMKWYDWVYAAHTWWKNRPLGNAIVRRLFKDEAVIPSNVKITYIRPEGMHTDLLCNDSTLIRRNMDLGKAALERLLLEHAA